MKTLLISLLLCLSPLTAQVFHPLGVRDATPQTQGCHSHEEAIPQLTLQHPIRINMTSTWPLDSDVTFEVHNNITSLSSGIMFVMIAGALVSPAPNVQAAIPVGLAGEICQWQLQGEIANFVFVWDESLPVLVCSGPQQLILPQDPSLRGLQFLAQALGISGSGSAGNLITQAISIKIL